MNESKLIRLCLDKDSFIRFRPHLREFAVLPETWEVIEEVGQYYDLHPEVERIDISDFILWARARKPSRAGADRAAYEATLEVADAMPADPSLLDRLMELTTALQLKDVCEGIIYSGGSGKMQEVVDLVDTWRDLHAKGGFDDPLAPFNLSDVFADLQRTGGLSWRLDELNMAIGPVCRGDLVLVGKRPEVGGTTFLTSEITHMVSQMPEGGKAVIFNNEESRNKVYARLIQSALNETTINMYRNPKDAEERYKKFLGTREIDVVHDTSLTTAKIDAVLKRKEYDVIGINVLWKVRPRGRNLEDFQAYQRVAQWARGVADKYAPVIGIWQADASAEGQQWLDQSQLYGSKTGVQGEADVQLMIGASHEPGHHNERYINVVKNKIPSSSGTNPAARHGKFTVDIDTERGRFVTRC